MIAMNEYTKSDDIEKGNAQDYKHYQNHQVINILHANYESNLQNTNVYAGRRNELITKVYALLSVQLLITFLVVFPMYLHKKYVIGHTPEFFWPSTILSFALLFVLFFTKGLIKLATSLLFSGMIGMMIGSAVIRYDSDVLVQSVIITMSITIGCSIFVHVTDINLHDMGGMLFSCLWGMIIASIVFIFFPPGHIINIVYSVLGIILFTAYILFDTSEMRTQQYTDEDAYIEIAVSIYLDIINLFLYILKLIDELKG
jgi:protein lifeguard